MREIERRNSWFEISAWIANHLGKNPRRGGSPAKESISPNSHGLKAGLLGLREVVKEKLSRDVI